MEEEINRYLGRGLAFGKRRSGVAALRQWVQKHDTDRSGSAPWAALSPRLLLDRTGRCTAHFKALYSG